MAIKPKFALIFALLLSFMAWGQNQTTKFGKNRVQYNRDFDEWSLYESDNFITYWYGLARNVGQVAAQIAEYDFHNIQNLLEHRLNEKIRIIVYADLTDLKQSNIGSEEAFENLSGQTKIVGNKIFVYFNGDHNHLRRQIRQGVASVYLHSMLFGSNFQEMVSNAVLLNLPDWYKQGLVSYTGEPWSYELENQLKDYFERTKKINFKKLADQNPRLAGHALWFFIADTYGVSTLSNLLYLTRINRSIESGFLYVLGNSFESIVENWETYYLQRFEKAGSERAPFTQEPLPIKNGRKLPITQLKVSPDGTKLVYVFNEIGRYKVFLHDIESGKRELVFKAGFRNAFQATDLGYPLIAWNPNNMELGIVHEKQDIIYFTQHDIHTGKDVTEPVVSDFQRVLSVDYANPNTLVFTATSRGFSDIFLYLPKTRQSQRITNDFYDDLDAVAVKLRGKNGILWSSNRPDSLLLPKALDTILPLRLFDIYYYNLEAKTNELVKITNTPTVDEKMPISIDTTFFAFLTQENGIFNRKMGFLEDYLHHYERVVRFKDGSEIVFHIDSTATKVDSALIDTSFTRPVIKQRAQHLFQTDYSRDLLLQHKSVRSARLAEMIFRNEKPQVFLSSVDISAVTEYYQERQGLLKEDEPAQLIDLPEVRPEEALVRDSLKVIEKQNSESTIPEGYFFQSFYPDPGKLDSLPPDQQSTLKPTRLKTGPVFNASKGSMPVMVYSEQDEVHKFRLGRIIPYRLEFRTDFVTTQMDNGLLFEGLEGFGANPGEPLSYPPPGILFKANFKDLLEDHELEGGVRVPTTFNGTEYFLLYNDRKRRLDKQYAIYRKSLKINDGEQLNYSSRRESNILLGQFSLKYPLDIFRSVRATTTLRQDKVTQLATDSVTFKVPTGSVQRLGLRLEYVFDNTLDLSMNIKNGTRYKFYAEVYKKFDLNLVDGNGFNFDKGIMGVLGFDARHYQRFAKHSILAMRLAGATSFGTERMLYFLGGVENWLFQSQNNEIPVPSDPKYAFKSLAYNMRGFDVNIRNGNSFALFNAELRIPVLRYLFRWTKSGFFRNFQMVGFFDTGTAWIGKSPYERESPLNTTYIENGKLTTIKVNFFRDPIVAGYGAGVRALLFGYLVRLDYAWGIETRKVQDPKLYLSLGLDF